MWTGGLPNLHSILCGSDGMSEQSFPLHPSERKLNKAKQIEKAITDLVDLCAANPTEVKAVDPRAWLQLLVYAGFSTRHPQ